MRVVGDAEAGERADDAAAGGADTGAGECRDERPCGHHRPDPGDSEHAEPRKEAGAAVHHRPDRCAGGGAVVAAGPRAEVAAIALFPVIGDEANIGRRHPRRFKIPNNLLGRAVIVVKSDNSFRYASYPRNKIIARGLTRKCSDFR